MTFFLLTALREGLYTQCRSHPYRISSCQLNAAPLYVATSRYLKDAVFNLVFFFSPMLNIIVFFYLIFSKSVSQ